MGLLGKMSSRTTLALGVVIGSTLSLTLGLLFTALESKPETRTVPVTKFLPAQIQVTDKQFSEIVNALSHTYQMPLAKSRTEAQLKYEGELLKRNISFKGEGHSYGAQTAFYMDLARQMAELRLADDSDSEWVYVCETGFNVGHSAVTFLSAHPRIKYVGFDILKERKLGNLAEETKLARLKTIEDLYGAERIELNWGDSTQTMAAYKRTAFCSVLVVDGGHENDVPTADLSNFEKMAISKAHVLVIDDICTGEKWCFEATNAWEKAIEMGKVKLLGSMRDWTEDNKRGWEWGRYKL